MSPDRTVLDRPDRPVKPAPDYSRSQAAVDDGLIRYRISLLAFDEPEVLVQAAHDLILNGFTASQFCMLGRSTDILDAVRAHKGGDGISRGLADLWAEPQIHLKLAGNDPVAMRCGKRAASLFETVSPHVKTPEWIRPDLSHSISSSVSQGRTILLVASSSAKQHALGARLLLRHGKHDLQTHEFSVRHPQ
jgi:hypothetical protein